MQIVGKCELTEIRDFFFHFFFFLEIGSNRVQKGQHEAEYQKMFPVVMV